MNDPRWVLWKQMQKSDSKFEWKMPISFYGKVIDQNGQPVQGAKIRFQWTDTSLAGTTEKLGESDAKGLFSLQNEKGKNLGVYVSKDNYHAIGHGRGNFEYAAFFEPNYIDPDSSRPVVFNLVKKIAAEPLVVGNTIKKLSYDRGEYFYDLLRGTLSQHRPNEVGLKFTITRSQTAQGQAFDWTWAVEGIHIAVRVTDEEFPQLAPDDKYVPSWDIDQKATTEHFQRQAHVQFYLRTEGGCHGRVALGLSHPNAREVGPTLSVKSFLNPKPGSRNLEFDPAKVVKSP
ncbi:MAG: carboxypeptidase-like regulatory domain-containing protein [Terrimicrobiaceae bacterium]